FSDKVEELRVGGDDVVQDRVVYVRCYSESRFARNFRGELVYRLVEFALIGYRYDLCFSLGDDLFDNVSRLNNLPVYSSLEICDRLVEDSPKLCQSTDVIHVVLQSLERMVGDELREVDVRAGLLGYRQKIRLIFCAFNL